MNNVFSTGALQEMIYLNPPSILGNPPHFWETVQGPQKDLPRAQKSDRDTVKSIQSLGKGQQKC